MLSLFDSPSQRGSRGRPLVEEAEGGRESLQSRWTLHPFESDSQYYVKTMRLEFAQAFPMWTISPS